jgi:transcriptional regulator with XRE-family HTH domain
MEITKKTIGARIRKLRKAKGLSQEQLSEKVGIKSKHLSRLEVGNNYPSLKSLESIAKFRN